MTSPLRTLLAARHHGHEPGFAWRGAEVSRIEGLSDAVFGFAITLLVVSLEVPRSAHEMVTTLRGFPGFGFNFFLLYRLWVQQYRYFRRYGLEDATTIVLNGMLLFVVLFFVYPLKFLTRAITDWAFDGSLPHFRPGTITHALAGDGLTLVCMFYGGFGAVFLILGLLYLHAYRQRDVLRLTELETLDTRRSLERLIAPVIVFPFAAATLVAQNRLPDFVAAALSVTVFAMLGAIVWRAKAMSRRRQLLSASVEAAAANSISAAPGWTVSGATGGPRSAPPIPGGP
ncbi:MAG: hypothetical protein NVS4B3_12030 [Gemmatimonadaceae bacterium]